MLRVKNWERFQHYRDRNPPWIKLHFSLISSSDWVALEDASRVLAVACMLIASRNEGQIDGSPTGLAYLKRVAYLNSEPELKPLIECGFLEPASKALALAQANARPETEDLTETENRTDGKGLAPPADPLALVLPSNIPYKEIIGIFNAVMTGLPKVREQTQKRRQLIRSAWQASKRRQSLKFWQAYFEECQEDDFLNGTGPYGKGHENWTPSFDFLMRNDQITKVYEKAMHRAERAA